jgi:hypothetical protein
LAGLAYGFGHVQGTRSVNKKVVIAVFLIGGSGVVNAAMNKTAVTPVILGSYIFLLVLSVLDAFGGPMATLSGALAMLAAVVVVLTEFPWGLLAQAAKGKSAGQGEAPGQPSGAGNQSRTTT